MGNWRGACGVWRYWRAGIHIALNIVLLILCWGRSGGARCVVLVLGSVCGCGPWSAVGAGFGDFLVLCRLGGAAHGLSQVESSARVPALSPEVYPAGKLQ